MDSLSGKKGRGMRLLCCDVLLQFLLCWPNAVLQLSRLEPFEDYITAIDFAWQQDLNAMNISNSGGDEEDNKELVFYAASTDGSLQTFRF